MRSLHRRRPASRTSLQLRFGDLFEAQATGWGIVAVPVALLCILAIVLLRWWLF
jgi:hypothetical protein